VVIAAARCPKWTAKFALSEADSFPYAPMAEPSTWAMMLLGFAGLGFAFRRSRRKAAFA
jgi:hypothetical protein